MLNVLHSQFRLAYMTFQYLIQYFKWLNRLRRIWWSPGASIDLVQFFWYLGFERLEFFFFYVYFTSTFLLLLFVAKSSKKLLLQYHGSKGVACQRYFWMFTNSHVYRSVRHISSSPTLDDGEDGKIYKNMRELNELKF